jgi:hypothetical protein
MRIGFGIAGFLLFIPAETMPHGEWTDIVGLALGVVLIGVEFVATRRQKRLAV